MNEPKELKRRILLAADYFKSMAEDAGHGATYAAEMNDGPSLRACEARQWAYRDAELRIRAALGGVA